MSQFQPVWSYPGPISSTDCTSTLINQFPVPPSTPMQPGQQFHHQQICMPAPAAAAYSAPAVISLGEEYTDETLPQAQTSYLSLKEDEAEEEEGFDYYDDNNDDSSDEGDYSPISTSSPSPTAMHGQLGAIPALWHAEHARLKHIQAAVLDNEREARSRELKLESEVARIKDDLARLKEARAQSSSSTATGPFNLSVPSRASMSLPLSSSKPITSPNSAQAPPQQRACGPRGPRPRPQQQSQSSRTSSTSSSSVEVSSAATITSVQAPPTHSNSVEWSSSPPSIPASLLGKFSFEEDDDTTETVLSMNLTEARSARAQERQRRKKENERIRELSMLLTLGSEVRKWEERLAWQQARAMASTPSSDDMNLESSTKSSNKAMDTDPDPRVKRLSRSSSLPSRGSYNPTAAPSPAASTSSTSNNGTTANNRSGPPSPALPSLAMSPLWRVSAEMILRRRSLSERPRRMPPKPLLPKATTPVPAPAPEQKVQVQPQPQQPQLQRKESSTSLPASVSTSATSPTKSGSGSLARPGHVLRGPREQRSGNSVSSNLASAPTAAASRAAAATSSTVTGAVTASASSSSISTLSQNATGVSSGSSSPSSGKRYSIPPPITIPPNSQFCTSTTATAPATGTGTGAPTTTTGAALRMAGQSPSANMANGTTTFLLSKTTPVRPSALKWAFTADDLARERELEARTQEADLKADQLSDSASSSSEGESDDSRQSSSCDSSSSSGPEASQSVERRGRARFSWRKSLPKDSNNAQPVANT